MERSDFAALCNEHGLLTRQDAVAAGLKDRHLRSPEVVRVLPGVYALRGAHLTHRLKCLAAAINLPSDAVLTGLSAATLHGAEGLANFRTPVEVLLPRPAGTHRRKGLLCSAPRTYEFEHEPWNGLNLAGIDRAAFDLLRKGPITTSVAHCDALLHQGLITTRAIGEFMRGRRDDGVRKARYRLPLLDGRAESIPESVLRVELALLGFTPVPQHQVWVNGRFLARLDLAFVDERVAVEYDGQWHGDYAQVEKDRARRRRLAEAGWTVIVVTHDQLQNSLDSVIGRIRSSL